jgi:hypothetical protein
MFEDAKVDAFLVRLHTPSDRMSLVDVHPAHNVALLLSPSASQLVYTFGSVRALTATACINSPSNGSVDSPFFPSTFEDANDYSGNIQQQRRRVSLGMVLCQKTQKSRDEHRRCQLCQLSRIPRANGPFLKSPTLRILTMSVSEISIFALVSLW